MESEDQSTEGQRLVNEDDIQDMLQKECELWQKKLYLQDWTIEVKLCRQHEMPNPDSIAVIQHWTERKDARMHLLAPIDIPLVQDHFINGEAGNYDISIVHELLHLHLIPLSDYENETKRTAEEQVVNALSRTIVKAYANTIKPVIPPVTLDRTGHYL